MPLGYLKLNTVPCRYIQIIRFLRDMRFGMEMLVSGVLSHVLLSIALNVLEGLLCFVSCSLVDCSERLGRSLLCFVSCSLVDCSEHLGRSLVFCLMFSCRLLWTSWKVSRVLSHILLSIALNVLEGFWCSVSCSLVDCSERLGRIFELSCVEMEVAGFFETFLCFCQTTGRHHIWEDCNLEECLFCSHTLTCRETILRMFRDPNGH
jgi:hypothetical protein